MYSYCQNSPIIFADPSGCIVVISGSTNPNVMLFDEPYCGSLTGPYPTADDAAKAFSEYVYSSSIYIRHEYATEIYSITEAGVTKYYFNTPRAGNPHSVAVGYSIPENATLVAYAHTHPNSCCFSEADIRVARNFNCDAYVVGPNLVLQKYDTSSNISVSIGYISPRYLSIPEKEMLVLTFADSWYAHLQEDCGFAICDTVTWPTG